MTCHFRQFFPVLDDTWRLVQRGVPQGISPTVNGRDCYVFQRRPRRSTNFQTHVIPVATFWGVRRDRRGA